MNHLSIHWPRAWILQTENEKLAIENVRSIRPGTALKCNFGSDGIVKEKKISSY